ncbi:MAG: FliH/SctL family protein [Planctomycetota bacterium]|jgi:flagellar biosynthesis/type III secretory pathway protein FliH
MASILKPKSLFGFKPTEASTDAQKPSALPAERGSLDSVMAQARAILEQCQKDCQELRETARREAVQEGRAVIDQLAQQRADTLVSQQMTDVVARVDAICMALENATQQWLRQWQHETVSLAIKIAEKLLVRQIESDPTILLQWIEEMVRLVQTQRQLTIRLSSADALKLSDALPALIQRLSPGVDFQIVDDPSMEECSVVLETPETTLDRSLKTQLERLQQELG